jgi:stage III sporulation protein AG
VNGGPREWLSDLWQHDKKSVVRLGIVGAVGIGLLLWGSEGGGPGSTYTPSTPPISAAAGTGPLVQEEVVIDRELTAILGAVPGAGRVRAAVTLSRSASEQYAKNRIPLAQIGPEVDGVVVVATGARRAVIREELTQAVETLLQVQPYQVLVLPNGGGS